MYKQQDDKAKNRKQRKKKWIWVNPSFQNSSTTSFSSFIYLFVMFFWKVALRLVFPYSKLIMNFTLFSKSSTCFCSLGFSLFGCSLNQDLRCQKGCLWDMAPMAWCKGLVSLFRLGLLVILATLHFYFFIWIGNILYLNKFI